MFWFPNQDPSLSTKAKNEDEDPSEGDNDDYKEDSWELKQLDVFGNGLRPRAKAGPGRQ